MRRLRLLLFLLSTAWLVGCGGSSSSDATSGKKDITAPETDITVIADIPTPKDDEGPVDALPSDVQGDLSDATTVPTDATTDAGDIAADTKPAELTCFELSLDPNTPLAIDGTFSASSTLWRRPHDDPAVCPATALLPETAASVPYVAYAFCNKDTKAHKFNFEMLAYEGPGKEAPLDDPYLLLYTGKGIPADALNCLAVNDDIPDAIDAKDSEITGITVQPGQAITMVGTTFTFDPKDGTGAGYYVLVVTIADE